MWKIRKRAAPKGYNCLYKKRKYYKLDIGKKIFIPISRNWRKLYFLFLSQSSQIGGNYISYFYPNLHKLEYYSPQ